MKIKKGDTVQILTGKDRSKTGKVLKIDTETRKALVDGTNLFKKHKKPKKQGEKGELIMVPRPIHISNLAIVCPNCKKTVKSGYKFTDSQKIRYCKKCNQNI